MSEQKLSESVKQRVAKLREFVSYAGKAEPVERLALDLANKLEVMELAAFKLHEGVERFTVTNAELSDEMYTLRRAIGYDRMSQLRAAAQEEKE